MVRLSLLFSTFTLAVVAGLAPGETRTKSKSPSFKEVVDAHFDRWVHGSADGKLAAQRVNTLVDSKEIVGDEAAALAAIHLHFRDHKTAPPYTKAALLATAGQKADEERRDMAAKQAHFDSNFHSFQHHLTIVPRKVFATDAPKRVGMSQGNLGDCYVVSAIGAAVTLRPQQVHSMIHPNADGSCDVYFPGAGRVHVPALTDAQIVLGSTAHDQGLWLNVLEEAFGEVGQARSRVRGKTASPGGSGVAIDSIAKGGDVAKSIEILSGKHGYTWSIRKDKGGEHAPVGAELTKMTGEVRQLLHQTVGHKLVCCSVSGKGKYPPGIVSDHAYAIVGFDASGGKVTVWNPWGQHFSPKGPAGLANGYAIESGEFTLPVAEFVQIFEDISYETDKPAGAR